MSAVTTAGAAHAPTQWIERNGRRLAYRRVGAGTPLVMCTRFRGNLDAWDPAFLDALAARGFDVITFDYSGLGRSTGTRSYDPQVLAGDALDLCDGLGLDRVVLGGWSLGGVAAQVFLAMRPARVSALVLIGTGPPGMSVVKDPEPLFFATASHAENPFDDEVILFFEPASAASREAARRSHDGIAARVDDLSVPVPWESAAAHLAHRAGPIFPSEAVLAALKATTVPILHLGGDHDISFPVENWYALNRLLPTVQLVTFPRTGHGPQHQHPEASAAIIEAFVRSSGGS